MDKTAIRNLKKGEFMKRKENSLMVFTKGHYDRATKSFSCTCWFDHNTEIFIKANHEVYYGFTF